MTSNITTSIRDAARLLPAWIATCAVFLLAQVSPAETLVNFTDFSAFASNWMQSGCTSANNWCSGVDYDISGTVDAKDLVLFSETWLASKDHVLSDDVAALIIHLNPPRGWSYDRAFMVRSLYEKWRVCHNPVYLKWVKDWLDPLIASNGTITGYKQSDYNLDMIQPGRLLLVMYKHFGDEKYKLAADKLLVQLTLQPTTFDGGFWHKQVYPRQMWLDGVYMAEPFAAEYAQMFNVPAWGDEATFQITTIASHTQDTLIYPGDPTRTGLCYHGWDGSAWETPPLTPRSWADPATGHSPEFWGRAMGWYAMAIVDCLDYLPADHPERSDIIAIFNTLATGLAAYQDPDDGPDTNNGMWWQVVNKGYPRATYPTNYTESSCTGMFSYAIGKAVEKGYITSDPNYYLAVSRAGLEGLHDYKVSYDVSGGWLRLKDTVRVGSLSGTGDYAYYMSIDRPDNDYKGVGALMLAALQYEKTVMPVGGEPPTPDPMTWAAPPYSAGTSSISMVAAAATDPDGVEYYFHCTTAGGHDSGWQDGTSYTDTGLMQNTAYTYQVMARDKSPARSATAYSDAASATTDIYNDTDPPAPNPMTWAAVPAVAGYDTVTMTASAASDTSGVEYYFANITDSSHDSGWQDGTTYTDTGLVTGLSYTYKVKARDKSQAQNETAWSDQAAATPTAPLIYQAEDAYFVGQGTVDTDHSGYTGTGYVNVTNAVGSYIEWTVNVPAAGLHTLAIRFANGTTAARTAEIKVNGSVAIASLSFAPTGVWTSWADQSFDAMLEAGSNTIRVTSKLSTGGPNYDKLEVIAFPAY